MTKRNFTTLVLLIGIFPFFLNAQVSKLNYFLQYNPIDSTYDMYIKIVEGTSKTAPQRAQFNSQISIIIPTNHKLTIKKNHMPLMGNNSYTGINPLIWTISYTLISPSVAPQIDFYSITPTLSPTSFYNDIGPGDEIKLFTFKIAGQLDDITLVRLYDNENDFKNYPTAGNFRQGFTIGGVQQDYVSNLPMRISTTSVTEYPTDGSVIVSPNPFSNELVIDTDNPLIDISVYDYYGKMVGLYKENTIVTADWSPGIYILKTVTNKGISITKAIKY